MAKAFSRVPARNDAGDPRSGLLHWVFRILPVAVVFLAPILSGCSLLGLASAAAPYAGLKMMFACIPAQTSVDTPGGARLIEQLQPGEWVIGFSGKPVRVLQNHAYLENPETLFLRVTFDNGATVDLCGMHRVAGIRAREIRVGQRIAGRQVTGIAAHRGVTRSYDLLTEDAGYQLNGVPVNSMIEEMHQAGASGIIRR
jgi:hypothetical protein